MEFTCFTSVEGDMLADNDEVWVAKISPTTVDREREIPSKTNDEAQNGFIFVLTYDYTLGREPWRHSYPMIEAIPVSEYKQQKSELIIDILNGANSRG